MKPSIHIFTIDIIPVIIDQADYHICETAICRWKWISTLFFLIDVSEENCTILFFKWKTLWLWNGIQKG